MTTDILTVSFKPWKRHFYTMDYAFSLSLRQLRLANKTAQVAKLLGFDTVHEYINKITKGFSANTVCKTAPD